MIYSKKVTELAKEMFEVGMKAARTANVEGRFSGVRWEEMPKPVKVGHCAVAKYILEKYEARTRTRD